MKKTGASPVDCGLRPTHKSAESNLFTGFVRMVHVRSQIKSTPLVISLSLKHVMQKTKRRIR